MKFSMTKKQKVLYVIIKDYLAENHGQSPSLYELCELMGVKSKSCVFRHLEGLEDRGWILRKKNVARSITLVEDTINLNNHQTRMALIAAGWTPPKQP